MENLSKEDCKICIVGLGKWHQIINLTKTQAHIIEIQYGDECIEVR